MKLFLVIVTCMALCHAQRPPTRTKTRRGPPPPRVAPPPLAGARIKYKPFAPPVRRNDVKDVPDNYGRRPPVPATAPGALIPVVGLALPAPAPPPANPPPPSPMVRGPPPFRIRGPLPTRVRGPPPPRSYVNPPIPRNPIPPTRTKSIGFIGSPIAYVPAPMYPATPTPPPPTYPPPVYDPPSPDVNKEEEEEEG